MPSCSSGDASRCEYGGKARGLLMLPPLWTPPFTAVSAQTLEQDGAALTVLAEKLVDLHGPDIIVRSSEATETLADRGRWQSFPLERATPAAVAQALFDLHDMGARHGKQMAAVVQCYRRGQLNGHISNERRVSKTRNQWQVEVERPSFDSFRLNSQRDAVPPFDKPISIEPKRYRSALRNLGNWAAAQFNSRAHLEWVIDGAVLWVVQVDLEDEMPDDGIDPRSITASGIGQAAKYNVSGVQFIRSVSPEAYPQYEKIRRTQSFSDVSPGKFPPLYVIQGDEVDALLAVSSPADALRAVAGDRLVCRTDLAREKRKEHDGLNLPRTDTCSPEALVEFLRIQVGNFVKKGVLPNHFVFIVHRFIPAVSGAWAEAVPGEPLVVVDALWGLPDGLQYLEHDRYEFNVGMDLVEAGHPQEPRDLSAAGALMRPLALGSWRSWVSAARPR